MEHVTKQNLIDFLKEVRNRMEVREKELAENNAKAAVLREELEYLNNVALSLDSLTLEKLKCEPEPRLVRTSW